MRAPAPASALDRRVAVAFAAYLACLAVAVLVPQPPPPGVEPPARALFGSGWLADALRNVVLFVPLGAGLRWRGLGIATSGALALLLSGAIEGAQLAIPGRTASPVDLTTNTLGALLGAAAPGALHAGRLALRSRAAAPAVLASGLACAVLGLTQWLAGPSLPDSRYYGGWTPDYGTMLPYGGEVVRASVGGVEIPPFGPVARQADLKRALARGEPVELHARVGPAPDGLACVLSIVDDASREILMIGVDRHDLVVHLRTRADRVGLHAPFAALHGALAGARPGDDLHLTLTRDARGKAVTLAGAAPRRVPLALARGWSFFWPAWSVPRSLQPALDLAWLAIWIGPVALLGVRRRATWALVPGVLGWVALLPALGPLAAPTPAQWAWIALVIVASGALGRRLDAWTGPADGAAQSPRPRAAR